MLVENNSNQKTTVTLTDMYTNGMSAFPMAAMPMEIAPGKRSKSPFIYSYNQLDISERSEIESIEFLIHFWDDSLDDIAVTPVITIYPNQ